MATYLYRIGRFAYRRKGVVLSAWLALLVLFGVGAATLAGPTSESFSIPGTPGQETQDLIAQRFPGAPDPLNAVGARYVFAAPVGQTLDEQRNRAAIDAVLAKVREIPQVQEEARAALTDPVATDAQLTANLVGRDRDNAKALSPLSPDRTVGYVDVPMAGDYSIVDDALVDTIGAAAQVGRDAGLTVEVSGSAAKTASTPGGVTELIGIAVAAIVLMLTFGSMVAAGLPLISAIIGIAIGSMGITIATGFVKISAMTPTLAMMIGLAVAIDYSLFVVSRYRHEITLTVDRSEAAGRAVGTAGSAVVFAGLTVIIALLALRVVGIPFLSDMGVAAAFTVFIAVLIALTLLPAVLGLFGGKAFAGKVPFVKSRDVEGSASEATGDGFAASEATGNSAAHRYARLVTRRPALFLTAAVLLLGVLAVPLTKLGLALPNESNADPATSARQAYDLIDRGFGDGKNGPLLVVVDAQHATVPAQEAFGKVIDAIDRQANVANAQIVGVNRGGDTAQILVTPNSGPTSDATRALVRDLRTAEADLHSNFAVSYGVTGQTAMEIDISKTLQGALVPYLLVIVGLAFLLLILVFRSLLVPLTATLGFLLSIGATFGATVAIFQEGWGGIISNPQPITSFMPIFLIGVVFGLAMDYQVFLVSRMREEYAHGMSAKDAVVAGFGHSARVVSAAAVIMISVFAAFIAEPDSFVKVMGFALASAVFFDAFVVRMVIIPSLMVMLGDKAWWLPRWLDRVLPNVDIEGAKLEQRYPRVGSSELEPAHSGAARDS